MEVECSQVNDVVGHRIDPQVVSVLSGRAFLMDTDGT